MTGHKHGLLLKADGVVSERSAASVGMNALPSVHEGYPRDVPTPADAMDLLRKLLLGTSICPMELAEFAMAKTKACFDRINAEPAEDLPANINGLAINAFLIGYHAHRLEAEDGPS